MKLSQNFEIKRNVLLNPGPCTTTDTVKLAQLVADVCPREKEFGDVMEFISRELTNFVASNNEYTTVLFGGSGTAVVEAILSSVIAGKKIFVVNNGSYSTRMCEILKTYNADFIEYKSDLISAINYQKLEEEIKKTKIDYLACVHNETGTGLLNDVEKIGSLCKKYNIDFIVDAMSTYAAIDIDMKKMNISFLAASANKSIQGMAGIGFVICNTNSLEKLKDIKAKSYYLDLYAQYAYFKKTKQTRFTPPVQTLYALKQAIVEAKEETIKARYNRYVECYDTLVKAINKLGLELLLKNDNDHSKIITAIYEPKNEKYNFNKMHDYFYDNGFTIYPGKVSSYSTFRIANIGAINKKDIEKFCTLLEKYLESIK